MTINGLNSGEVIKNIAHYDGDYFIVCLESNYSGTTNTLTYGVGPISGTTFTIQERFTVVAENTYSAVQDIDYKDGYLWAILYKSDDTMNNIHLIEIPASYSELVDGKTYSVKKTVSINKNEAGRSGTRNELESVYVYGSNFYTWSNIRTGWYETFCRYPRFPNGVKVTSVTTKSDVSLEVKWAAESNVDQYRIDRRAAGEEYATITMVDSSKTSYTDTGLKLGTKYYYRVYGINSAGTSPKRDGVFGVTKTAVPKVNSITAISESELRVKWTAVSGAKKYIVCRRKENTAEGWEYYKRVAETTGTEYLDTGLEPNTLYDYGVIAINENGIESGGEKGNPGDNKMSGRTLEAIAVVLNSSSLDLIKGASYKLDAIATPEYASSSTINWISSDSSIVSVDQDGNITALEPGTAVITATEQMKKRTADCTVTVYEPDFVLPSDLTEIKEEAFKRTDARFVYVPDSCEKIGAHAFCDSNIEQIRIPANCEIGDDILEGCENVIIFGTAGSEAEQYARDHGNRFVED
jgi:fibronectin type 3 domain-containing protein